MDIHSTPHLRYFSISTPSSLHEPHNGPGREEANRRASLRLLSGIEH